MFFLHCSPKKLVLQPYQHVMSQVSCRESDVTCSKIFPAATAWVTNKNFLTVEICKWCICNTENFFLCLTYEKSCLLFSYKVSTGHWWYLQLPYITVLFMLTSCYTSFSILTVRILQFSISVHPSVLSKGSNERKTEWDNTNITS